MNAAYAAGNVLLLFAMCGIGLPEGPCLGKAEAAAASQTPSPQDREGRRREEERRQFQSQELIPARAGTWIFHPGDPPRVIWRDVDEVRRLGGDGRLQVRWFDAKLNEAPAPREPGRWCAWIEGTAPNGTPLRRALTLYAIPKDFFSSWVPDLTPSFPGFPGPAAPAVWREHQSEFSRLSAGVVLRALIDSQTGAILLAGLAESKPLGRPARFVESAGVLNDDYHLALKLKLQGLQHRVRPLKPPRRREPPATVLREGSLAEAEMRPDAKARIDALCRTWAEEDAEPFVTLVARRGVIVTHEAFGRDRRGAPVGRDYRCWVASITKTVTAILFSLFLDQGLIALDDSLAAAFPDYPRNDPHVPTFRQCFNHTSGLAGHADFGGMRNPHLENIVLNGIDVNAPNVKYAYSGLGFELAAKAMEIVAGKSAVRLYDEHLFRPLGLGDVPMGNASSDGEFTAWELGVLAQWVANRGSYGEQEFIAPRTFAQLLPEPLRVPDRGFVEDEGIGMHWIRHARPGAPANSKRAADLLFSPRTVGHGSFSGCMFVVDLDQQIVITQVRKQTGPRHADWSGRFFRTVAEAVIQEVGASSHAR